MSSFRLYSKSIQSVTDLKRKRPIQR